MNTKDNMLAKTDVRQLTQILFWGLLAAGSLARGFYNATVAQYQSKDLMLIIPWVRQWLWATGNPYQGIIGLACDYPPHALTFLAPWGLIPDDLIKAVWALFNILIAPIASIVTIRLVYPTMSYRNCLLPTLMFLCWANIRIGIGIGQVTLVVMFLGLLAVFYSRCRPVLAGIFLGLSLLKPHVALVYFLWAILTKRFKTVFIACLVVLFGNIVFFLRNANSFFDMSSSFVQVIRLEIFTPGFLQGGLEIRPLLHMVFQNYAIAEAFHWTIAALGFAVILVVAFKKKSIFNLGSEFALLQIISIWSLMIVFHNIYDRVTMLPVFVGLYAFGNYQQSAMRNKLDSFMFWFLQITTILNISGIAPRLPYYVDITNTHVAVVLISHFGRVFVFIFFIYYAYRLLCSPPIKIKNNFCSGTGIRNLT